MITFKTNRLSIIIYKCRRKNLNLQNLNNDYYIIQHLLIFLKFYSGILIKQIVFPSLILI